MTRGARGEGKIRQRSDGRYEARVMLGYDQYGKEIRKSVYGKTKEEVRKKRRELLVQHEAGQLVNAPNIKFGDWVTDWLAKHAKISTELTTWENYVSVAENHIIPALGRIMLSKLTTKHLQDLYAVKMTDGRKRGKGGLSPTTIRRMHHVCQAALGQAVKQGLLLKNVASAVSLPKMKRAERVPLSAEQVKVFLQAAARERLYAAFYLLLATGMRRGEVLGLKWDDIDLDQGIVKVRRSLRKTNTQKQQFAEPKTAKSKRALLIGKSAVAVLKEHQERQLAEIEAAGEKYEKHNLVFCREDGHPLYPDVLNGIMDRILTAAKLPHTRVHDLRHTYATLQAQKGTPIKTLESLLGHTTPRMLTEVYLHAVPEAMVKAVENIEEVLVPKEKKEEKDNTKDAEDLQTAGPFPLVQ